jgi:hypothetical protein
MNFPSDEQFAADARRELLEDILPFWRSRAVDNVHGGFIAEMSNDLTLKEDAAKGLILNSRLLWTFSAAYRYARNAEDEHLAHRAYDYLTAKFFDSFYGGYFWELDAQGSVLIDQKKIYGQALRFTRWWNITAPLVCRRLSNKPLMFFASSKRMLTTQNSAAIAKFSPAIGSRAITCG